eukprot:TRINITY_DN30746_c0_g1_i1.p1 TRINITY_DN30746_c0_g1~~TRINITY_DN30746_c0_g1_i1.p1  ORF type:complete len:385 (+),score=121.25 TRINITY_DN30746_c0_g1_i1:70-1155(+)
MADVVLPLAEFVGMNAAFSFGSDVTAQLFEGRRLWARRRRPAEAAAEADRPVAKRRRPRRNVLDLGSPRSESGSDSSCGVTSEERSAPDETQDEGQPERGPAAEEVIDYGRSAAFAGTGVVFCGVAQFIRLRVIDEVFEAGDQSLATAVAKTGVNQLVFSPVIRAASMATITYHATRDWSCVRERLRDDFCEAQTVSYMVKPASNLVAFVLFPNHILAQAVVMRTASFAYNVYYSCVTHKSLRRQAEEENAGAGPAAEQPGTGMLDLCCECVESPRSEAPSVDADAATSTADVSAVQSAAETDTDTADLEDLRVIMAHRRRRYADWEARQQRAARLRQQRAQQAAAKRQRGACLWLRGLWS